MPETLDNLIERIRREGLEKAKAESAGRLAEAGKEAAAIVEKAGKEAAAIVEKAGEEARRLDERARRSLEQAARDALLTVSRAIDTVFEELARRVLTETLNPDALRELLKIAVSRYFEDTGAPRDVALLVPKDTAAAAVKHLMAEFGAAAAKGLTIGADDELLGGFRVARKDEHLTHDFSDEAMAELLCAFLRPELAAIVRKATGRDNGRAASEKSDGGNSA